MTSDPKVAEEIECVDRSIKHGQVDDCPEKSPGVSIIDEETIRKLLRKIDMRLMPVMCFTYAFQYYDKVLSQAAIFGLRKDLSLEDDLKYSWVSLILLRISWLSQRFTIGKVCPIICFLWAILVLTTPACTNYAGILASRFMLGLIESGVSPAFMLCTGMWYTQSERNIISPLIKYGLGHITSGALQPWQYMYLVAGLATLLWSGILWLVFPGSPQAAKGFTEEERILVVEREALLSYHFWFIFFLSLLSSIGRGAVTTFGSIFFNGMGFTTFESLLLNIGACVLVILGSCLIVAQRIAGFYLINFFSSVWVQCIAMGTSNVAGLTKKATMAEGIFMGYSLGNIAGPLTFDADDAPRYDPGFQATVICFAICFVLAQVFRAMMYAQNKRRDSKYGPPTREHGLEDLTDAENKSFRYPL
ncbi:major facilitator superfamily domain-containing protein [Aspergillus aurantiobrunneus]